MYLFLQLNNKIRVVKTKSNSCSRSSRTTPNKESFIQDFKQTKEINEFSKESQDLIADMSNTEIFELCETSSKQIATCIGKQALSIVRAEDA